MKLVIRTCKDCGQEWQEAEGPQRGVCACRLVCYRPAPIVSLKPRSILAYRVKQEPSK